MMTKTEIDNLTGSIDLVAYAERYTTLHRESSREYSGPCPKCGGDDRFHVSEKWFFCRVCHEKRGDAIDFVRWMNGCNFREAVETLTGKRAAPTPTKRKTPAPAQDDRRLPDHATIRVQAAQERLLGPDGAAGRDYLADRGLLPATWQHFGLGYGEAKRPDTEEVAPAILIPWRNADGRLVAIRYRFLTVPEGGRKLTSMGGSTFTGNLFGVDQLFPSRLMTLVITEGEFNAMAVWQVAGNTRLDVVSVGSESGTIPDDLVALAGAYGSVIAWLDKPEHAGRIAAALPGAVALKSAGGLDANDRLRRDELGGMLAAQRLRLCKTQSDREALLWNLYDGGLVAPGLDVGTAAFVRRLAGELGKGVTINQRADHWTTGLEGR